MKNRNQINMKNKYWISRCKNNVKLYYIYFIAIYIYSTNLILNRLLLTLN